MRPARRAHGTLLVASLTVFMSGCGQDSVAPFTPSPSALPPPAPAFPVVTVTGQVSDAAGRAVAANVAVYPLRMAEAWYGPWGRSSQADASGRYRIANAPEHHDAVYVRAWKDGYVQQCAKVVILATDASADLTVTAKADVVITGLPTFPNTRQISGTVYDNAHEPIAGAWVGWEGQIDTVFADTVTDAQGRYRLCGLPRDPIVGLYAVRTGTYSPVYADVAAGGETVIDLVVP